MDAKLVIVLLVSTLLADAQAGGNSDEDDECPSGMTCSGEEASTSGSMDWNTYGGNLMAEATGSLIKDGFVKTRREDMAENVKVMAAYLDIKKLDRGKAKKTKLDSNVIILDHFEFEGQSTITSDGDQQRTWVTVATENTQICARVRVRSTKKQRGNERSATVCVVPGNGMTAFQVSLAVPPAEVSTTRPRLDGDKLVVTVKSGDLGPVWDNIKPIVKAVIVIRYVRALLRAYIDGLKALKKNLQKQSQEEDMVRAKIGSDFYFE